MWALDEGDLEQGLFAVSMSFLLLPLPENKESGVVAEKEKERECCVVGQWSKGMGRTKSLRAERERV